MVKVLNVVFSDEEYKALLVKKGDKSWREFLLGEEVF
jgi:hypothetical protein